MRVAFIYGCAASDGTAIDSNSDCFICGVLSHCNASIGGCGAASILVRIRGAGSARNGAIVNRQAAGTDFDTSDIRLNGTTIDRHDTILRLIDCHSIRGGDGTTIDRDFSIVTGAVTGDAIVLSLNGATVDSEFRGGVRVSLPFYRHLYGTRNRRRGNRTAANSVFNGQISTTFYGQEIVNCWV